MSVDELSAMRVGDRVNLGTVVCVLDDPDGRAVVTVRMPDCHKLILQRVAGKQDIVTHHL